MWSEEVLQMVTVAAVTIIIVWLSAAVLAFAACMLASRVDQDLERYLADQPEGCQRAAA